MIQVCIKRFLVTLFLFFIIAFNCSACSRNIQDTIKETKKLYNFSECLLINITSKTNQKQIVFTPISSNYYLFLSNVDSVKLEENKHILILIKENKLLLQIAPNNTVITNQLEFRHLSKNAYFQIRGTLNTDNERLYYNNLIIENKDGFLNFVNDIMLDKYIEGVVFAELGSKQSVELYKVQSILARTYALSIFNKHAVDSYNLCDQTHCQAYKGIKQIPNIIQAVKETEHIVVVDQDNKLINAVFHSNSGGETMNSEDLWGGKLPYLRTVTDNYSYGMPNYLWTKLVSMTAWLNYLKKKYNYPINDSAALKIALSFEQPTRLSHIVYKDIKVPLKECRKDFNLKSTFFSINKVDTTLIFNGKGFGHGVGLSQEGATMMVKRGFTYNEIINFYYQGTKLSNLQVYFSK